MGGANAMALKRPPTMGVVAVLALVLACAWVAVAGVQTAFAIPIPVLPETPVNYADDPVNGVVGTPDLLIQLQFTDSSYPIVQIGPNAPTMTLDGFPVTPTVSNGVGVTVGYFATGIAPGSHAASVTVRNTNKESATHTWTFKYNPPPVVGVFSPADDAYITSGPPYLFSTTITDLDEDGNPVPYATLKAQFNAMAAAFRPRLQIDGLGTMNLTANDATQRWEYTRATAINTGDVWFTNTTIVYDPATGTQSAAPTWKTFFNTNADVTAPTWTNPQPPNGSTTGQQPTFSVDVRDNRPTNLTVSWILDGSTAATNSYPQNLTQHQANQPTTVSWQPPSNMSAGNHTMQVQVTDASSNSVTSSIWSIVVAASIPPHITTTPFGTCSGCHVATLTTEHENRGYTCDEPCHTSSDPRVVNAIDIGDTACEACHGTAAGHEALHDTVVPTECTGNGCHTATNLVPLHANDCATCHASSNQDVLDAIEAGDKECASCHDTNRHEEYFAVDPVDRVIACNRCHWVTSTHMYHNLGSNCGKCHKDGGGISFGFRVPYVSTMAGWFNAAAGQQATAGQLHSIHLNPTWLSSWRSARCASCHERAACSACHGDVGHADHSYDEDTGTYASAPWTGPVSSGTPVGDLSTSGLSVVTETCVAAGCHDLATTPPVVVKDPGLYAANPIANAGWGPFTFSGYWRDTTASSLYVGERVHDTASVGARVDASFVGTRVRIIGPKRLGYCGIADVYLDGVKVASINAYSVQQLFNQVLWESGELAEGTHALRIVHSGQRLPGTSSNYFAFDCLEVLSSPGSFGPSCAGCH